MSPFFSRNPRLRTKLIRLSEEGDKISRDMMNYYLIKQRKGEDVEQHISKYQTAYLNWWQKCAFVLPTLESIEFRNLPKNNEHIEIGIDQRITSVENNVSRDLQFLQKVIQANPPISWKTIGVAVLIFLVLELWIIGWAPTLTLNLGFITIDTSTWRDPLLFWVEQHIPKSFR